MSTELLIGIIIALLVLAISGYFLASQTGVFRESVQDCPGNKCVASPGECGPDTVPLIKKVCKAADSGRKYCCYPLGDE